MILDRRYTGLPADTHLNEMQELVAPFMDSTDNVLVASPTASGKSTLIPMLGTKYLDDGASILYVGSMKALVEEKVEDWAEDADHPWYKVPKTIITGDYQKNAAKQAEIDAAKLIVITPESLSSYLRKVKSESSYWLYRIGLIVVDEIHLVGQSGRGANLEASLMEFCYEFPDAQVLGLSATMPNVDDLGKWISNLNSKKTIVIKSDYRPVPLAYDYIPLERVKDRKERDYDKLNLIVDLILSKPDEQFMVGVFNKAFGDRLIEKLTRENVTCAFHNANHTKASRNRMELAFKGRSIRVLVGTCGVFTGVNFPAKNVIISETDGFWGDVETCDLQQLAGRAGRPKYDKEGNVYVLVYDDVLEYTRERIENGEDICSRLLDINACATHFLGAMYMGRIQTRTDFHAWYGTSLACLQNNLTEPQRNSILNSLVADMEKRGMVVESDGKLTLTKRGTICAQMLFNPYDMFEYIMNMHTLFHMANISDLDIARALGSVGYLKSYISNDDMQDIPDVVRRYASNEYMKSTSVIYLKLAQRPIPPKFMNVHFQVMQDFERVAEVLVRLNNESEGWKQEMLIRETCLRIKQNLSAEDARLYMQNLTRSQIRAFKQAGLQTYRDASKNKSAIASFMQGRKNNA